MATRGQDSGHHSLKKYYVVFGALLVFTIATVAVAQLHLGVAAAIAVAVFIACIKGSLVASFFMHLAQERGPVFWLLAVCAVLFIALIFLPSLVLYEEGSGLIKFVNGVSGK